MEFMMKGGLVGACLALGILVANVGCGGGKSEPSAIIPKITLQNQHGSFHIDWTDSTRPSTVAVHANINGSSIDKTFTTPQGNGMVIYFSGLVPEMTPVSFRFEFPAGTPSASTMTNVGPYPASILLHEHNPDSMLLSWSRKSEVADRIRIQRYTVDPQGNRIGSPIPVALLDGATVTYKDTSGPEGSVWYYTVTYESRGIPGPPTARQASFPPLFSVGGLKASATTEGVKLTWTNRSTRAVAHLIHRAPGTGYPLQTLRGSVDATATEFFDEPLAVGEAVKYWVTSYATSSVTVDSEVVHFTRQ